MGRFLLLLETCMLKLNPVSSLTAVIRNVFISGVGGASR